MFQRVIHDFSAMHLQMLSFFLIAAVFVAVLRRALRLSDQQIHQLEQLPIESTTFEPTHLSHHE